MRVRVESRIGPRGERTPQRIRFDDRVVEVAETLDRWPGAAYAYVKVRGADGNLYLLRLDESRGAWELTLFRRGGAGASSETPGGQTACAP